MLRMTTITNEALPQTDEMYGAVATVGVSG